MSQRIAIIDYSSGNLHSVYKKLCQLKVHAVVCQNEEDLHTVDKIILPGIGHFGAAMNCLRSSGLFDALQYEVLTNEKPVLGICLGMQLMAKKSEEALGYNGLGWIDAEVRHFNHTQPHLFRTPHTGWNTLTIKKTDSCIGQIGKDEEFYFNHSYHLVSAESSIIVAETDYEYSFISVFRSNSLFGVQFHPEKSHTAGEKILKNFLEF
jgi:imidazole glycerol-phosphate synthase subunit HisH